MTEIIVVGDCHGDLNQFIYPLLVFFHDTSRYKYLIYLGDYIDRGHSSVNIYIVMRWVMSLNDPRIIFLRGNHDDNRDRYDRGHYPSGITVGPFGLQVSFLAPAFATMRELKNCFYDQQSNIMFAHSGFKDTRASPQQLLTTMNNPLYDPIDDNQQKLLTKGSTYKLIHGHDHAQGIERRSNNVPSLFFNNTSTRINADLSLDYDCSYGFAYIMRAFYINYPPSQTASIFNQFPMGSRVIFCIFKSDRISEYRFPRVFIPYDDPQDLNTKSLAAIETFLLATIPNNVTGGALNLRQRFMPSVVQHLYNALSMQKHTQVNRAYGLDLRDLIPQSRPPIVPFLYDDVTFELLEDAGFIQSGEVFDPPGIALFERIT